MRALLPGCLAAMATFPAFAVTEAYVLIETTPGQQQAVIDANWGFGQCKGLVHSFMPDEIVMQIACNDVESLHKAVANDLPGHDGVRRVTLWTVSTEP